MRKNLKMNALLAALCFAAGVCAVSAQEMTKTAPTAPTSPSSMDFLGSVFETGGFTPAPTVTPFDLAVAAAASQQVPLAATGSGNNDKGATQGYPVGAPRVQAGQGSKGADPQALALVFSTRYLFFKEAFGYQLASWDIFSHNLSSENVFADRLVVEDVWAGNIGAGTVNVGKLQVSEGIDMGGSKITNLGDAEEDTDAVNLGQVKRMADDYSGIAGIVAMSNLVRQVDQDKRAVASLAYGRHGGRNGFAVGGSFRANDNVLATASISMVGKGKGITFGLGAGFQF